MQLGDEDFDNVNPGEGRILIEEGLWPAKYLDHGIKPGQYGEKLTVRWGIVMSADKIRSVILPRFYNLKRDKGERFMFGHLHAYRRDWVVSNNGRLPMDSRKLPPSIWKEGTFLVEVVTVRSTRDGSLPPSLYYSRVGRVIRPLDEEERWERLPLQPLNSSR